VRVLLTGASGFIGRELATALPLYGHSVTCVFRHSKPDTAEHCEALVEADFVRDHRAEVWVPRLRGIDAVINAVGILREQGMQTFASLHVQAPRALFQACVQANVRRVIQISALGADQHAVSPYHVSKRRADEHLSSLPLDWIIVQPSLVYGASGASAALFNTLATLPIIPLPGRGQQLIQPVHIKDVVEAIARALDDARAARRIIPLVGPVALSLREYLATLRAQLNLGDARFISIPMSLVRGTAALGSHVAGSFLDQDTLAMLERGNSGDAQPITAILNRPPRAPVQFIAREESERARHEAQLRWVLPMLRVSIALVWIGTALVSFGLYPRSASYELLGRVGVPSTLQPLFLYGAATFDLALGIATLFLPRRPALWCAQLALILAYTALITWRLPEFWLHPYGPILKNLPMLAMIFALYVLEKRR
jgi:uncharacterized protein YbjT (DUF2867 family)